VDGWAIAVWIVWKIYPPFLWKSSWLEVCYVDNVENLSTESVDNTAMGDICVDGVENLSTGIVDNSKSPLSLQIIFLSSFLYYAASSV
jgi:hypothetical protein